MTVRRQSLIKFVVLSLILGIFTVPNQAQAVDTITKSFTIRGADNALLPGAMVGFYWSDPVTLAQVIGTPVTANSSGVATITAPLNAPDLSYAVFPPVGDRVNAAFSDLTISSGASGTVNVKLEMANFFVNVQKSDGSEIGPGAVLAFPKTANGTWNRTTYQGGFSGMVSVVRSGVVGIKIAADLNPNSDYAIAVLQYVDNFQPGQFSWRYGLKAAGNSGSQTYTMYTDGKFTTPLAPVDNAYVLKFSGANIIGTMKNSDGSTFTMTPGMTLNTDLKPSGWTPASFPPPTSGDITDAAKSPNGQWSARGLGGAGKYQLTFTFGGSLTIPSFSTFIWKNSEGGWSLTENGTYSGSAVTPAQIEVRRPATSPNVAFQVINGETQQPLSATWELEKLDNSNTYNYVAGSRLVNGKLAAILPDGEFLLHIFPADARFSHKMYEIVVTNNVITSIVGPSNVALTPVNGIYSLALSGPNLSGVFKDSSGNDLVFGQNQWIDLGVQKKNNGRWEWANTWSYETSAQWSVNFEDTGEFRFVARPNGFNGISESYSASFFVATGNPKKLSLVDAATAASGDLTSLSGINITMRASNLMMNVVDPRDNSLLKYGWISIFQKMSNGDQTWVANADIRQENPGLTDIRLDDGNYRLEVNPQYNGTMISGLARKYYDVAVSNSGANVAVSYNNTALTAASNGRFTLSASAANITGKIADPSGNPLVGAENRWVSINVQKYVESRKEFDWTSNWSNTDQNGDFSISVTDPGKYRLRIQPTGFTGVSTFYSAEFIITNGDEKTDFSTLRSPAPTLTGTVYASNGTTAVRDARVRVVDTVKNVELWQFEANTSATGAWSMNLPAGTYAIYAVPPYGNSSFGNSDKIGTVTVNSSGVAALTGDAQSGRTATTFNLSLKAPTWSGTVKSPTGDVVSYATVCLQNNNTWNCTDADVNGAWALSAPSGFTAFSSGAFVEISDNRGRVFPRRQFTDLTASIGGVSGSGSDLRFQASNVAVTILGANNAPVQDVWVTLSRQNEGWLGGNNTNSAGVAQIYVADLLTKSLEVRVEIGGNSPAAGIYSGQFVQYTSNQVSTNATANSNVFRPTIQLTAPNLSAVVRDPSTAIVAEAWVELLNASTNEFVSSTSSNSDGKFSLNAPKPTSGTIEYVLNVNPAWNSTSVYSKQSYSVIVDSNNAVAMTPRGSQTAVATNNGVYALSLANPNVSGSVVYADNTGAANSWVVPISASTGDYMWQYGSNTRPTGTFGMNLPNDTYKIDANLPWNSSGVAKPAQCTVTVAGGVITSPESSCVIVNSSNQKVLKLALRTPNVTFTMKQGGSPVANVNVSLGVGSWYTNAQSNSQGVVSLFVDPVEIAAKSGLSGVQNIHAWIDPPWGTSTMVRWECDSGDLKPICSDLTDIDLAGTTYAGVSNRDVTVVGPNARILIKDPRTQASVGVNAWVGIFAYDTALPQNGSRWVGGSNSDVDGFVSFNVETMTATTRFTVEINPPWDKRVALTRVMDDNNGAGYTDADLKSGTLSFTLGTPNTVVTVKAPGGTADNKYGWIGVEEVDSTTNNFITWVGGYGLNDTGTASIALTINKRYRITANASSGRPGAQTVCYIDMSGSTTISKAGSLCGSGEIQANTNNLTITMVAGNVAGYVKFNDVGVPNATVYASLVGATNDDDSVFAATTSNGQFGFNLDFSGGKQWVIKVFPFNAPGAATPLANQTLATLSADNASLLVNLAAR
jgi:hypothetical protein